MKFATLLIIMLFPVFALADNAPVFIVDSFDQFESHWSIALIINKGEKKQTIYLVADDLRVKDKSIAKLSDSGTKRSCNFKRSITPNVLSPNEWFQVVGNLSCEFNGLKIAFNPVTCEFKSKEKKEMSNSSSARVKNGDEDLYFIYGCNIFNKK